MEIPGGERKLALSARALRRLFFWGVKTCKNPLPTRQRTRGESIRRVPELPCGTKGCKTDILPHSTYHRTILGLKCQHPPSPRHPLNSHFVRRVKLRLAYRPAFVTCHFNGIMFNSSQIMFQKNQKTQDRGIWFSMFKSCREVWKLSAKIVMRKPPWEISGKIKSLLADPLSYLPPSQSPPSPKIAGTFHFKHAHKMRRPKIHNNFWKWSWARMLCYWPDYFSGDFWGSWACAMCTLPLRFLGLCRFARAILENLGNVRLVQILSPSCFLHAKTNSMHRHGKSIHSILNLACNSASS